MKWLGAMLTLLCSALLGGSSILHCRQRVRALRALIQGLGQMRAELNELYTPMPELLRRLAERCEQPASELFAAAAYGMEKRHIPFSAAWELSLKDTESLALLPEEERALASLGGVLGRSSAAQQGEALLRTEKRLELFLELEQKERLRQSRVKAAVGAGAGIMLVILLL